MSYLDDTIITDAERDERHVQAADDRLTGSAPQNKAVFDALPEYIVEKHNELITAIQTKQTSVDNAIAGLQGENKVYVDTTDNWNAQAALVSEQGAVYIYTDHIDGTYPGFKVGDGLAYLIDLPFNDDLFTTHIGDTDIHVTNDERAFWNNKVSAFIDAYDIENLILSTEEAQSEELPIEE